MKTTSESKENLVPSSSSGDLNESGQNADDTKNKPYDSINESDEYILTPVEKKFLLTAERGDCAGVRRLAHKLNSECLL